MKIDIQTIYEYFCHYMFNQNIICACPPKFTKILHSDANEQRRHLISFRFCSHCDQGRHFVFLNQLLHHMQHFLHSFSSSSHLLEQRKLFNLVFNRAKKHKVTSFNIIIIILAYTRAMK